VNKAPLPRFLFENVGFTKNKVQTRAAIPFVGDKLEERLRTLESILAGDPDGAEKSMRRVLNMVNDWLPTEALHQPIGRDMALADDDNTP
jgi:DNA-binding FadR family transcriptional regulator